jgi:hypothetical protein
MADKWVPPNLRFKDCWHSASRSFITQASKHRSNKNKENRQTDENNPNQSLTGSPTSPPDPTNASTPFE